MDKANLISLAKWHESRIKDWERAKKDGATLVSCDVFIKYHGKEAKKLRDKAGAIKKPKG